MFIFFMAPKGFCSSTPYQAIIQSTQYITRR
jgi:hypothetical protein